MPYKTVVEIIADEIFQQLQKTNRHIEVEVYFFDKLQFDEMELLILFSSKEAISNYLNQQKEESIPYNEETLELLAEESDYYKNNRHDVFISYKREESKQAFVIRDLLKQWGIKTWIDQNGIYSSYDFKQVIEDAYETFVQNPPRLVPRPLADDGGGCDEVLSHT